VGGNQVRLRLSPKAAPAEGRPKGAALPYNQSREAHHPARPHHSPSGHEPSPLKLLWSDDATCLNARHASHSRGKLGAEA
jgi:hypothetical protein